nr:MAG TPA: hypothetical protein [Caudoviricetes sp.]
MIYSYITGNDTLIFTDNTHQIASINFKSSYKLYFFLKMCVTHINCFTDFINKDDINYSSLTNDDINYITNNYNNMILEFNNHIESIERG